MVNYIPLRIRALDRLIKLHANVKKYFGEDLNRLRTTLGPDYWKQPIRKLAPEIAGEINIEDTDLLLPHWKHMDKASAGETSLHSKQKRMKEDEE